MANTTVRIPLRNRAGVVVAHAVIDAADSARVTAAGPWHRSALGYVVHTVNHAGAKLPLQNFLLDAARVDHINRDRLDNRRTNLRHATQAENNQNVAKTRGTSRYRGVFWDKRDRKWIASCKLHRVRYILGYFDDEDEAGSAAAAWRAEHMPYAVD